VASYHHGSLPQALIAASVELIGRDGLEGFSLARAARAAGVTPAAPYAHFADKTDLLAAIADTGFRRLADELTAAATADDPADALLDLGSAYVGFVVANPALSSVMFARRGRPPRSDAGLTALGVLGGVLERLAAAERLRVPVDTALRASWALVHGLAVLTAGGMRTLSDEDGPEVRRTVLRTLTDGGLLTP
jgi:AcrR family transcriptional regulator